jgi:uncharacterized membrane protein
MWSFVRHSFVRGLIVIIPLVITVWVVNAIITAFDRIVSPMLVRYGLDFPGIGFITILLLIFVVGVLSRNLIGKFVVKAIEGVITRIPLARTIYSAVKDIIGAFSLGAKGKSFRRVVVVEYPRKGIYSVGFVTNDIRWTEGSRKSIDMVSVYFLFPPNPTSGIMVLVPVKDVYVLTMSVEEGLKLALSGGIVAPEVLRADRAHKPKPVKQLKVHGTESR